MKYHEMLINVNKIYAGLHEASLHLQFNSVARQLMHNQHLVRRLKSRKPADIV